MSTTALIEALCGRGWDAPVAVDLARAEALLSFSDGSIFAAAATGDLAHIEQVLAADPAAATRSGGPRDWPPLLYAATSHAHALGRGAAVTEGLARLLAAGADPDTHYTAEGSDNGFSALYLTIAVSAHRPRTDALLAAGAHPSDGNSSYHAVETFDIDLLHALGAAGLEPDDVSYTIKHAIDMGWVEAVLYLLSLGADPDAVHPASDETTLHWAVKRNAEVRIIEALLAAGADPNARTRTGIELEFGPQTFTPLDFALRLGHAEAAQRMVAAGGVPTPPSPRDTFVYAVAAGDAEQAEAILAMHPDLQRTLTRHDHDLLAFWAQHGRRDATRLACRLGFSRTGTAWMGLTALHWAALRADAPMVRQLLDDNVPVVDLGDPFQTPRHTAETCQWTAGDYDAVLKLL